MTLDECIVVSAYTGYVMAPFNLVHKYIEDKLGFPVWTHELADERMVERIREATRDDFLALCARGTPLPPRTPCGPPATLPRVALEPRR
jgi:hypothetical protein